MLKINLLSENDMAQKSKSEKDGNLDFFNRKKWGKISNISNTNTTVVFGENQVSIDLGLHTT